jgi:hypothetical protein
VPLAIFTSLLTFFAYGDNITMELTKNDNAMQLIDKEQVMEERPALYRLLVSFWKEERMNPQPSYYELQAAERVRELRHEIANERLIASLPRKPRLWRRGVRRLGLALIAVGRRLERAEQPEQTVVYS